jgi:hypothetical protein
VFEGVLLDEEPGNDLNIQAHPGSLEYRVICLAVRLPACLYIVWFLFSCTPCLCYHLISLATVLPSLDGAWGRDSYKRYVYAVRACL